MYRCLATEIDTDKPNLSNISIISHDMDHIMENGLTIIVSMAQSLVWLQHVSERNSKKFHKLLASTSDKKRILSHIYGSQKMGFYSLVWLVL